VIVRMSAFDPADMARPSHCTYAMTKFLFDLNQIRGFRARTIVNGVRSRAMGITLSKENFEMNITEKLFLASVLALSIAGPVQAQGPTAGDYYAPGPTTVVHPTQGQLKLNEQGDYYVGDKMILTNAARRHSKSALITSHLNRTVTWHAWRRRARLPRRFEGSPDETTAALAVSL
jgi:hypothetical protein